MGIDFSILKMACACKLYLSPLSIHSNGDLRSHEAGELHSNGHGRSAPSITKPFFGIAWGHEEAIHNPDQTAPAIWDEWRPMPCLKTMERHCCRRQKHWSGIGPPPVSSSCAGGHATSIFHFGMIYARRGWEYVGPECLPSQLYILRI